MKTDEERPEYVTNPDRIEIPDWEDAKKALKKGDANPLDIFIYYNEPAGRKDVLFREQLRALIEYVNGIRQ